MFNIKHQVPFYLPLMMVIHLCTLSSHPSSVSLSYGMYLTKIFCHFIVDFWKRRILLFITPILINLAPLKVILWIILGRNTTIALARKIFMFIPTTLLMFIFFRVIQVFLAFLLLMRMMMSLRLMRLVQMIFLHHLITW